MLLGISITTTSGAVERSRQARAEFVRANPCPATGRVGGACAGYQVDHVRSLCAGGVDSPSNMQWLSIEDHRKKTANDIAICRAQRAGVLQR